MFSLGCRIRSGEPRDVRAAARILVSAFAEHGLRLLIDVRRDPDLAAFGTTGDGSRDDFVAVSGGKVCGFLVLLRRTAACGEIKHVFVASSHRGRGVGTSLLEHAKQRARDRGYRRLVLETDAVFANACRYYERHGWSRGPDLPSERWDRRTYSLDLVHLATRGGATSSR